MFRRNGGYSILEYIFFVSMIMVLLYLFGNYIRRGLYGRWQSTGATFAHGRQYDPNLTVECQYDQALQVWYDETCFDNWWKCGHNAACGAANSAAAKTTLCPNAACGP